MIWLIFAAMVVVVLAILLVPMLRIRPMPMARGDYDLAVYRDQLAELERDLDRGVLKADQADAARTEIQRRMLACAPSGKEQAPAPPRPIGVAVIIALLVCMISSGRYMQLGSPNLHDQPFSARAAKVRDMQGQIEAFQGMVDKLSERLQADPSDGKGWAMLGRSLKVLGKSDQAAEAYEKAIPLLPGDVQVRSDYAMILLDEIPLGSPLPPRVVSLMGDVLAIDGNNPNALYFLGVAESQAGRPQKARELWKRIMDQLPPDSEDRVELQRQMDGLK